MDADEFFATQPPPGNLEQVAGAVRDFVALNNSQSRRIVLVSSGGTTVPLENQTVRFLDNFSAGTRGAASAEYFIEAGYAVIFLHRQFSLEPYTRHYTHSKNCFLDFLAAEADGQLRVRDEFLPEIAQIHAKYHKANKDNMLLKVDFVTLRDYLFMLRRITQEISKAGRMGMYYLAAAVSDFFIPMNKMHEHKIQSGNGDLKLSLDQVPKTIKPLVEEWSMHGYIVSFKLETDDALLLPKSRAALQRYGHQLVIGNMLLTRKNVVHFIFSDAHEEIRLTPQESEQHFEIERHIVSRLVVLHNEWIAQTET
ncbi:DNA/pantothenate metabolism flavoprotein [Entophlyctis helioformis]|nr:DNA/pantothenate metabolism flavoprotein [Entophlyctis helioformis]